MLIIRLQFICYFAHTWGTGSSIVFYGETTETIFILGVSLKINMDLNTLDALSPLDGRYRGQVIELSSYFSEFALIKYRLRVEVEYFIRLCEIPLPGLKDFPSKELENLRELYTGFTREDAEWIKDIERTTNHDVKAVEYFLKHRFSALKLGDFSEFVHFGLTSQDVNNTAIPLSFKEAIDEVYLPLVRRIHHSLETRASIWRDVPMLARTHGQPATPTLLGKEFMVFAERLSDQLGLETQIPYSAKFGGATGGFNAHYAAFSKIDWQGFAEKFIDEVFGLKRSRYTTQIEHYDHLAARLDTLKRINTILLDLVRDIWQYISMDYFKQTVHAGEVGSSAMPHKINPIDFENAEGNLGLANALFEHLSAKLPVSRLQRDLTDSTVIRNLGVPVAHTVIALKSIEKGLSKLILNEEALHTDLSSNWAVVAEAIQTVLRREGYPQPYEALKGLTRKNEKIGQAEIQDFINSLPVSDTLKEELKTFTPFNYTGKFELPRPA